MRRTFVALAMLALPLVEKTAFAEDSPSPVTESATSEETLRVTQPARKPDLPSRAGPILLIVGGGATLTFAGSWLLLGALGSSMCESSTCTQPDMTGFAVAAGAGAAVLTAGIVWLVDVNHRRHAIERANRSVFLPLYEPTTRTAGFTFSQQF